jgi:tetratricopeptide (TPR) repeat protein
VRRALVHVAAGQYAPALGLFEEALAKRPGDVMAANNAAVCRLYAHDVIGAIKTLEACVRASPSAAGDAAVASNLTVLYDLAYDDAPRRKRVLRLVLATYAPHLLDSPEESGLAAPTPAPPTQSNQPSPAVFPR